MSENIGQKTWGQDNQTKKTLSAWQVEFPVEEIIAKKSQNIAPYILEILDTLLKQKAKKDTQVTYTKASYASTIANMLKGVQNHTSAVHDSIPNFHIDDDLEQWLSTLSESGFEVLDVVDIVPFSDQYDLATQYHIKNSAGELEDTKSNLKKILNKKDNEQLQRIVQGHLIDFIETENITSTIDLAKKFLKNESLQQFLSSELQTTIQWMVKQTQEDIKYEEGKWEEFKRDNLAIKKMAIMFLLLFLASMVRWEMVKISATNVTYNKVTTASQLQKPSTSNPHVFSLPSFDHEDPLFPVPEKYNQILSDKNFQKTATKIIKSWEKSAQISRSAQAKFVSQDTKYQEFLQTATGDEFIAMLYFFKQNGANLFIQQTLGYVTSPNTNQAYTMWFAQLVYEATKTQDSRLKQVTTNSPEENDIVQTYANAFWPEGQWKNRVEIWEGKSPIDGTAEGLRLPTGDVDIDTATTKWIEEYRETYNQMQEILESEYDEKKRGTGIYEPDQIQIFQDYFKLIYGEDVFDETQWERKTLTTTVIRNGEKVVVTWIPTNDGQTNFMIYTMEIDYAVGGIRDILQVYDLPQAQAIVSSFFETFQQIEEDGPHYRSYIWDESQKQRLWALLDVVCIEEVGIGEVDPAQFWLRYPELDPQQKEHQNLGEYKTELIQKILHVQNQKVSNEKAQKKAELEKRIAAISYEDATALAEIRAEIANSRLSESEKTDLWALANKKVEAVSAEYKNTILTTYKLQIDQVNAALWYLDVLKTTSLSNDVRREGYTRQLRNWTPDAYAWTRDHWFVQLRDLIYDGDDTQNPSIEKLQDSNLSENIEKIISEAEKYITEDGANFYKTQGSDWEIDIFKSREKANKEIRKIISSGNGNDMKGHLQIIYWMREIDKSASMDFWNKMTTSGLVSFDITPGMTEFSDVDAVMMPDETTGEFSTDFELLIDFANEAKSFYDGQNDNLEHYEKTQKFKNDREKKYWNMLAKLHLLDGEYRTSEGLVIYNAKFDRKIKHIVMTISQLAYQREANGKASYENMLRISNPDTESRTPEQRGKEYEIWKKIYIAGEVYTNMAYMYVDDWMYSGVNNKMQTSWPAGLSEAELMIYLIGDRDGAGVRNQSDVTRNQSLDVAKFVLEEAIAMSMGAKLWNIAQKWVKLGARAVGLSKIAARSSKAMKLSIGFGTRATAFTANAVGFHAWSLSISAMFDETIFTESYRNQINPFSVHQVPTGKLDKNGTLEYTEIYGYEWYLQSAMMLWLIKATAVWLNITKIALSSPASKAMNIQKFNLEMDKLLQKQLTRKTFAQQMSTQVEGVASEFVVLQGASALMQEFRGADTDPSVWSQETMLHNFLLILVLRGQAGPQQAKDSRIKQKEVRYDAKGCISYMKVIFESQATGQEQTVTYKPSGTIGQGMSKKSRSVEEIIQKVAGLKDSHLQFAKQNAQKSMAQKLQVIKQNSQTMRNMEPQELDRMLAEIDAVWLWETWKDGTNKASIWNYTDSQLRKKIDIAKNHGLTMEEIDRAMRNWYFGNEKLAAEVYPEMLNYINTEIFQHKTPISYADLVQIVSKYPWFSIETIDKDIKAWKKRVNKQSATPEALQTLKNLQGIAYIIDIVKYAPWSYIVKPDGKISIAIPNGPRLVQTSGYGWISAELPPWSHVVKVNANKVSQTQAQQTAGEYEISLGGNLKYTLKEIEKKWISVSKVGEEFSFELKKVHYDGASPQFGPAMELALISGDRITIALYAKQGWTKSAWREVAYTPASLQDMQRFESKFIEDWKLTKSIPTGGHEKEKYDKEKSDYIHKRMRVQDKQNFYKSLTVLLGDYWGKMEDYSKWVRFHHVSYGIGIRVGEVHDVAKHLGEFAYNLYQTQINTIYIPVGKAESPVPKEYRGFLFKYTAYTTRVDLGAITGNPKAEGIVLLSTADMLSYGDHIFKFDIEFLKARNLFAQQSLYTIGYKIVDGIKTPILIDKDWKIYTTRRNTIKKVRQKAHIANSIYDFGLE